MSGQMEPCMRYIAKDDSGERRITLEMGSATVGIMRPSSLYICLDDKESVQSYFSRFKRVVIRRGDKEDVFAPDEFVSALYGRPQAKRIRITCDEHDTIGHDECGNCGQTVCVDDRFCCKCGASLDDEPSLVCRRAEQ